VYSIYYNVLLFQLEDDLFHKQYSPVDIHNSPTDTAYGVFDHEQQPYASGGHHRCKRHHADDFSSCRSPECEAEDRFLLPPLRSAENPAGCGDVSGRYSGGSGFRTTGADQFGVGDASEVEYRLHDESPSRSGGTADGSGTAGNEQDFLYESHANSSMDIIKVGGI
jgi:hypothetical protein